jgi:hypothetical protein
MDFLGLGLLTSLVPLGIESFIELFLETFLEGFFVVDVDFLGS